MKRIDRTPEGYRELKKQADAAPKWRHVWSGYTPANAINSAEINASDTIREDTSAEWYAVFWASLESVTTWPEMKPDVRAWFERRGIAG